MTLGNTEVSGVSHSAMERSSPKDAANSPMGDSDGFHQIEKWRNSGFPRDLARGATSISNEKSDLQGVMSVIPFSKR